MILKHALTLVTCRSCQLARLSSIATNYEGLVLRPRFSNEQQEKILEVLNNSNAEQLSRFDVSQGRIKSLDVWRKKKGPFKSLADVLEVDGLGVKVLERLCDSIITVREDAEISNTRKSLANSGKNRKQYIFPPLDNDRITDLESAVGIHIRPAGISWTKISRRENRVAEWNLYDFSSLPKKMLPTDTFQLAMTILNKIPSSDVYIFEATQSNGMQSAMQSALVTSYNQQLELTSMLLALINTSAKHSHQPLDEEEPHANNVYYLKSNLSARLFNTLMGNERVSSTTTVSNLLEQAKAGVKQTLPCSPIKIEDSVVEKYHAQSPAVRELLGQSLMLIITFMDLCVFKNPVALQAVLPRRRKSL